MSSSSDEGSRTPTPQDASGPRKDGNPLQRNIKQESDCLVRFAVSGAENHYQECQMMNTRSKKMGDCNPWGESKLQPGSYSNEFSPKNGKILRNKYANKKCGIQNFQRKEFTFSVCGDPDNIQYAFAADPSDTLLFALNTSCDFEEKVKSDNTILAYGEGPLKGLVNLDILCCYLPQHSHFRLLFLRSQNRDSGERPHPPEYPRNKSHVLFYVEPSGRMAGNTTQRIVLADRIAQGQTKLCILGFEGETIRETLVNDGRFDSKIEDDTHKLLEKVDPPRKIQFNNTVDTLHGRSFQIEMSGPRKKAIDDGRSPKLRASKSAELAAQMTKKDLDGKVYEAGRNLLPKWHLESRRASLLKFKQSVSRNADLAKVSERQYLNRLHQEALSSVPARAFRCISDHLSSVGCIAWKSSTAQGSGTCFVLKDRYVVTCYHVVEMMTENAVGFGSWPSLIRDCAEVFFGYEQEGQRGEPLKLVAWLEIYDQMLDYAVLELESFPGAPGLIECCATPPKAGILYITGHPEGDKKKICPCSVVTGDQRAAGCAPQPVEILRSEITREDTEDYTHDTVLIASQAFNRLKYSNVITYKTEFHYGAAGSPIFNSEGSLVALHCGGETYKKNKDPEKFYIELGRPILLILHDIISKNDSATTEKTKQIIVALQNSLK
ncbi:serine protease FAM111A-like [Carcharodon carcharias]|uniref:serine protease FAM111A-like n=1 Tax=Carcharodon carcharias TaxID=13397 RepID=UPI001B7E271B|nr:serine protease FAM111A-like [Carcharodon carcharias]